MWIPFLQSLNTNQVNMDFSCTSIKKCYKRKDWVKEGVNDIIGGE